MDDEWVSKEFVLSAFAAADCFHKDLYIDKHHWVVNVWYGSAFSASSQLYMI